MYCSEGVNVLSKVQYSKGGASGSLEITQQSERARDYTISKIGEAQEANEEGFDEMFQKAFKKVMQAGTNGIVKKVEPEGEQEEAKSIFNFEGFVQP